MRRPVLALVLLAAISFFVGLGRPAIADSDEGFYAEAAREMVESGDWLTPHFNYADRWQKPVLYYWTAAAAYLVTGPTEWSARWFSALSGVGLVWLTWLAAIRLSKQPNSAFLAGAIVATCYGYFYMARQSLPDLPLAFFITAGIWCALDRRWLLAGLCAGLGFLMKGPVALVIPGIVLLPIWWQQQTWPRIPDLAKAAVIAIAVGVPWYVAMWLRHGTPYLESFFLADNLERFATTRYNDPRFVLYYAPIVIGGLLPWSMFLLVLPWKRALAVVKRREQLDAAEWQLLIWAVAPLVFFTLSVGKQPRYILPVLPPLAILLSQSITKRIGMENRGIAIGSWLTAVMFAVIAALLWRAQPLFITAYPAATMAAVSAVAACAVAVAFVAMTRRWGLLPGVMLGASLVTLLAVQFGAFSGVRPEPVEQMANLVKAHRGSEAIGEYQVFVRNLTFYTGIRQEEIFNEAQALSFLARPERVLLVAKQRDVERLDAIAGTKARRLGEVRYLDQVNIRLRTMLFPLPAQDVDSVLLVSNR